MRLAFESAGGRCVYSNEWNKYSQQTYFANFGEQPEGDITKVDENSIPDHDVLVAGLFFSDDFKIVVSDTQAYKQFGNSVVVPLMADVAKLIVNRIRELDYESRSTST